MRWRWRWRRRRSGRRAPARNRQAFGKVVDRDRQGAVNRPIRRSFASATRWSWAPARPPFRDGPRSRRSRTRGRPVAQRDRLFLGVRLVRFSAEGMMLSISPISSIPAKKEPTLIQCPSSRRKRRRGIRPLTKISTNDVNITPAGRGHREETVVRSLGEERDRTATEVAIPAKNRADCDPEVAHDCGAAIVVGGSHAPARHSMLLMRMFLYSAHIGLPACSCRARMPSRSARAGLSVKSRISTPFK